MFILKNVETFENNNLFAFVFVWKKRNSSYMILYQPSISYTEFKEQ